MEEDSVQDGNESKGNREIESIHPADLITDNKYCECCEISALIHLFIRFR